MGRQRAARNGSAPSLRFFNNGGRDLSAIKALHKYVYDQVFNVGGYSDFLELLSSSNGYGTTFEQITSNEVYNCIFEQLKYMESKIVASFSGNNSLESSMIVQTPIFLSPPGYGKTASITAALKKLRASGIIKNFVGLDLSKYDPVNAPLALTVIGSEEMAYAIAGRPKQGLKGYLYFTTLNFYRELLIRNKLAFLLFYITQSKQEDKAGIAVVEKEVKSYLNDYYNYFKTENPRTQLTYDQFEKAVMDTINKIKDLVSSDSSISYDEVSTAMFFVLSILYHLFSSYAVLLLAPIMAKLFAIEDLQNGDKVKFEIVEKVRKIIRKLAAEAAVMSFILSRQDSSSVSIDRQVAKLNQLITNFVFSTLYVFGVFIESIQNDSVIDAWSSYITEMGFDVLLDKNLKQLKSDSNVLVQLNSSVVPDFYKKQLSAFKAQYPDIFRALELAIPFITDSPEAGDHVKIKEDKFELVNTSLSYIEYDDDTSKNRRANYENEYILMNIDASNIVVYYKKQDKPEKGLVMSKNKRSGLGYDVLELEQEIVQRKFSDFDYSLREFSDKNTSKYYSLTDIYSEYVSFNVSDIIGSLKMILLPSGEATKGIATVSLVAFQKGDLGFKVELDLNVYNHVYFAAIRKAADLVKESILGLFRKSGVKGGTYVEDFYQESIRTIFGNYVGWQRPKEEGDKQGDLEVVKKDKKTISVSGKHKAVLYLFPDVMEKLIRDARADYEAYAMQQSSQKKNSKVPLYVIFLDEFFTQFTPNNFSIVTQLWDGLANRMDKFPPNLLLVLAGNSPASSVWKIFASAIKGSSSGGAAQATTFPVSPDTLKAFLARVKFYLVSVGYEYTNQAVFDQIVRASLDEQYLGQDLLEGNLREVQERINKSLSVFRANYYNDALANSLSEKINSVIYRHEGNIKYYEAFIEKIKKLKTALKIEDSTLFTLFDKELAVSFRLWSSMIFTNVYFGIMHFLNSYMSWAAKKMQSSATKFDEALSDGTFYSHILSLFRGITGSETEFNSDQFKEAIQNENVHNTVYLLYYVIAAMLVFYLKRASQKYSEEKGITREFSLLTSENYNAVQPLVTPGSFFETSTTTACRFPLFETTISTVSGIIFDDQPMILTQLDDGSRITINLFKTVKRGENLVGYHVDIKTYGTFKVDRREIAIVYLFLLAIGVVYGLRATQKADLNLSRVGNKHIIYLARFLHEVYQVYAGNPAQDKSARYITSQIAYRFAKLKHYYNALEEILNILEPIRLSCNVKENQEVQSVIEEIFGTDDIDTEKLQNLILTIYSYLFGGIYTPSTAASSSKKLPTIAKSFESVLFDINNSMIVSKFDVRNPVLSSINELIVNLSNSLYGSQKINLVEMLGLKSVFTGLASFCATNFFSSSERQEQQVEFIDSLKQENLYYYLCYAPFVNTGGSFEYNQDEAKQKLIDSIINFEGKTNLPDLIKQVQDTYDRLSKMKEESKKAISLFKLLQENENNIKKYLPSLTEIETIYREFIGLDKNNKVRKTIEYINDAFGGYQNFIEKYKNLNRFIDSIVLKQRESVLSEDSLKKEEEMVFKFLIDAEAKNPGVFTDKEVSKGAYTLYRALQVYHELDNYKGQQKISEIKDKILSLRDEEDLFEGENVYVDLCVEWLSNLNRISLLNAAARVLENERYTQDIFVLFDLIRLYANYYDDFEKIIEKSDKKVNLIQKLALIIDAFYEKYSSQPNYTWPIIEGTWLFGDVSEKQESGAVMTVKNQLLDNLDVVRAPESVLDIKDGEASSFAIIFPTSFYYEKENNSYRIKILGDKVPLCIDGQGKNRRKALNLSLKESCSVENSCYALVASSKDDLAYISSELLFPQTFFYIKDSNDVRSLGYLSQYNQYMNKSESHRAMIFIGICTLVDYYSKYLEDVMSNIKNNSDSEKRWEFMFNAILQKMKENKDIHPILLAIMLKESEGLEENRIKYIDESFFENNPFYREYQLYQTEARLKIGNIKVDNNPNTSTTEERTQSRPNTLLKSLKYRMYNNPTKGEVDKKEAILLTRYRYMIVPISIYSDTLVIKE